MVWNESDNTILQECLDRLVAKQREFQLLLTPIDIILKNLKQIQIRETISFTDKKEQVIIKIKPKDRWGNQMNETDRQKIKNEIVTKTNELLGEPADE